MAAKTTSAVVTFQADDGNDRASKEPCVGRTVREVAGLTAVNPNGSMFKSERTPFVGMAFQTRLFVLEPRVDHVRSPAHLPNRSIGAVGVVAIRADHEPFIHPVFERLGKLGSDIVVAAVTDLDLTFCQKAPIRFRLVNGMARSASDIRLGVGTAANVGPIGVLGMATQTGIQCLVRRQLRKGDDALFAALGINMPPTWPMTAFTSNILWRGVLSNQGFVVRIPKELERDIRVARAANHAATKTRPGLRWFRTRSLGLDLDTTQEPEHGIDIQIGAKRTHEV